MSAPIRSEFETLRSIHAKSLDACEHAALVSGLVPRLRMLRLVLARIPKEFTPYKHVPEYRVTYYIEKLSCGHERIYYPQAGPMSRRRFCSECASLALPPKKPVSSSQDEQERAA